MSAELVNGQPYHPVDGAKEDVATFAVVEIERNDARNSTREATHTLPVLVRRVHSSEFLPRPFTRTVQLIICSYLSVLCCCFCGAFAAEKAMAAKLSRDKGIYIAAKKHARRAAMCIIAAVISGALIVIVVGLVVGLTVRRK
ncbi:unnamed protein product [Lymnaea stagnalis]|uniref:Uncharacterized protein n=1 Tax=Lymnaea stagnalis TaxID=6523 RepID=A0AAV2HSI1_LYMST